MLNSIISLLTRLCRSVISLLTSKILPLDNLPTPSGPYAIGFSVLDWIDASRDEWFTEQDGQKSQKRRLVVQVWYPAMAAENPEPAAYLDHGEQRLAMVAYQVGLPVWLIDHVKKISSNALLDAPRLQQLKSPPLILFSHGLGGMKNQNSIQAEELASHGYMVVAVDHAYDAYMTIFSDGSIADYRSAAQGALTPAEFRAFRTPQLATRTADLSFVLDEISRRAALDEPLWLNVDARKTGVFGHSYGGATSFLLAATDSRIVASVALDGWMLPLPKDFFTTGLKTPFLYIGQGKWKGEPLNYRLLDKLVKQSAAGLVRLLPGSRHFDFSDAPQFSRLSKWLGLSGSVSRHKIRTYINAHLLTFFGAHFDLSTDDVATDSQLAVCESNLTVLNAVPEADLIEGKHGPG